MATRFRPQSQQTRLALEALSIEGELLSRDWMTRVAQLAAGHQSEVDYRVPQGLHLRDELDRSWRIAQACWAEFKLGRAHGGDTHELSERFVQALLRGALGFTSLRAAPPVVREGDVYPIGFAALGGRVPVVIASAASGLDALSDHFGGGGRHRSASGLMQEFLNAEPNALWGLTSDGLTLRILRRSARLSRPAWLEASLERIFLEERQEDFAALWLIAHESRFGRADQPATPCALEAWREVAREQGLAARGALLDGVEAALAELGNGFLAHPENDTLREALRTHVLTPTGYFNELLRCVYRLLFLLTVEERGLLHPEDTPEAARRLYEEDYGLKRLRERPVRRGAPDRHEELWEALRWVLRGVAVGEPRLGLPALAGLFASSQCPHLDAARLQNRALLSTISRLSWVRGSSSLSCVDWRDLRPEELGSVYEDLLERVPRVSQDGRAFEFATGGGTRGNTRKTTGSYYTPDSLVQVLLDTALEPVIERTLAANPHQPVEALLELSIVDPACGSGHFLLAAARRLAVHVARLQAQGMPSAAEYRHALRQVVGRCIHGVDLNPMAVELCKVSLWMEAAEPGLPLGFLDSQIQHGNALLGTTPELMAQGIPDAAWRPIEGDDKRTASTLEKRNREEALEKPRGMEGPWSTPDAGETPQAAKGVADAWCAAFVWPAQPGALAEAAPTNELWRQLRDGTGPPPGLTEETTTALAAQYRFLHWHLAFPRVFAQGGFDVVLGNPPWERVKLLEQEFFASRSEEIAQASNASVRKRLIAELPLTDPPLWREWCAASREAEGQLHFVRQSRRYPLCGKGDVNTYALFAEHGRSLVRPSGHVGMIIPSGIATENTTRTFFDALMSSGSLLSFWEFENEGFFSAGKGHMLRFGLLTLAGRGLSSRPADFFFQGQNIAELGDPARHFSLTREEIHLVNPNTGTCPIFRTRRDAALAKDIHRRIPILLRDGEGDETEANPWGVALSSMFHMTSDAELFRTAAQLSADGGQRDGQVWRLGEQVYVPLYEAKMLSLFTHRHGDYADSGSGERAHRLPDVPLARLESASYSVAPHWWVPESAVDGRLSNRPHRPWFLVWRDVTDARASARTVISAIIPRSGVANSLSILFPARSDHAAVLLACLSSFALDYVARQKIAGLHLNFIQMKQLPVLPPSVLSKPCAWSSSTVDGWLLPRILELTYTAWDLEPFAHDVGYAGPPFRWDPERRFKIRCELDAAFFQLYGFSRDETAYVLDTFPVIRRSDEKAHGEYRTQRVILERYDAMARAIHTGAPYVTVLEPPPADPRMAHTSVADRKKLGDATGMNVP